MTQTEAIFDNIATRISDEIRDANHSIYIAVAWFTNQAIFNLLLEKAKQGCKVSLMISNDKINDASGLSYNRLSSPNWKVYKIGDGDRELMHNKFCVIDRATVITGSYNWSYKAERQNFENIILTNDGNLAEQFIAEFHRIKSKYYSNEPANVLPLDKVMKRLEVLQNYIILEDLDDIDREASKLETFALDAQIKDVCALIRKKEYTAAILGIKAYIERYQQLSKYHDPEIAALKLEVRTLEHQLNALDNEKIEVERLISQFQTRHSIELGGVILKILHKRKLLFKDNEEKYKEAEEDERNYQQQVDEDRSKKVAELTEEEKKEIKTNFRKATMLCHPDKVAEAMKEHAEAAFVALKDAYDRNDIARVNSILKELENGVAFKLKSESITEKDGLLVAVQSLRRKIQDLELYLTNLREHDTYRTISGLEDWDEYFKDKKTRLKEELERLESELAEQV
jgi:PLD-like domain